MVKEERRGFILIVAIIALAIFSIYVYSLISMTKNETKWAVKQKKTVNAFQLAEAGLDRGTWKLQEGDEIWTLAMRGSVIAGYNNDVKYSDVEGGFYRIRFTTGPGNSEVTVTAEGKDSEGEVRALQASYLNRTIPGAIISGGVVTLSDKFEVHWGPIMAHNNINITDPDVARMWYPRKYSKQAVTCSVAGWSRDTNSTDPPNQGLDWYSAYPVPALPILDFTTLRAQAQSKGLLNVYGCSGNGIGSWWSPTGTHGSCSLGAPHATHLQDTIHHSSSNANNVWYWDGDVTFTGGILTHGVGIYGTIIVRGNMTIGTDTGDNLIYVGTVPANAWQEYAPIDTAAVDQYPGDLGISSSAASFSFGAEQWSPPTVRVGGGAGSAEINDIPRPSNAAYSDVGFRGFIYVGGNLVVNGPLDVNGAIWVAGNVSGTSTERTIIYYNDNLNVPALNVVLVRQSWRETKPSTTAWPP